ncbi:hypothetical protein BASA61_002366 [Batrachochytrium salamandrivorans]|nr:hypothetical protein BASA61_002366 [Batrachochytrium salamandrivorans]
MKLAIASTTLLFAMMAAQAAVLSTTSSTGVNLVKRAPTSDDETDVEQSDMAGQSSLDQAPQLPFSKHEEEEIERLCDMAHKEMLRSMPSLFNRLDEVKEYKFFRERLQREREEKNPI